MSHYAVLQEAYEKLDPDILGPILADVLGMVRYDAMRMAREGRGILVEYLNESFAQELQTALRKQDIQTRIVPQKSVIQMGRPMSVRDIQLTTESLEILEGYTGRPTSFCWNQVCVLSAGVIVEVQQKKVTKKKKIRRRRSGMGGIAGFAVGGVIGMAIGNALDRAARGGEISERKKQMLMNQIADLFIQVDTAEFRHFRLKARDLYYSKILGDHAVRDIFANFRLVLKGLSQHATKAVITPETMALAKGGSGVESEESGSEVSPDFGEEMEFTQYNQWVLQVLNLNLT